MDKMQLKICVVLLQVMAIFAAHTAYAAPPPPGGVIGPQPPPPPPYSTEFCRQSTLTEPKFIQLVKAIIKHGDLTDIPFMEKTLGTKFSTSTGWKKDGTPNPQTTYYSLDKVLGSPLDVQIDVWSKDMQKQRGIANIDFQNHYFPQEENDYMGSCLHISANDFSSSIGGQFLPLLLRPLPGAVIENLEETIVPGKSSTKLLVSANYGADELVDRVQIIQRP